MKGSIVFKYRKCGRTGTPWSRAALDYKIKDSKVVFDFNGKNAEISMNFYRKMVDSIQAVDQHNIVCSVDALEHQHIEKLY